MIKGIIFDYDGVIAESVQVKTQAFADIYEPYGSDVVAQVITHHEANGGISRFEKIKIYHKQHLGVQLDGDGVQELADQFSDLVLTKVIDSPYVPGAYEFLASNQGRYDLFISTGTPTDEIETILAKKNTRKYFKSVYGSPESKTSHVLKIIEETGHQIHELVFIGDAITDRDAARNTGVHFIGRFTTIESIKNEKLLIKDFKNLADILLRL
jgi:phosphoglycolate phosphatase-like HAD superfamily hydrolase